MMVTSAFLSFTALKPRSTKTLKIHVKKITQGPFSLSPPDFTHQAKTKLLSRQAVWYSREKMGQMLPQISRAARFSRRYNNHHLRSTVVQLLSHNGGEMMSVAVHRCKGAACRVTGLQPLKKRKSGVRSYPPNPGNSSRSGEHL